MYESKAVTNTFGNAQRFMSRTATPLKQEPNTCTCIRPIFNEKKTTDHPNSITNKFPNAIHVILEIIL